jgi:hypothetical protein
VREDDILPYIDFDKPGSRAHIGKQEPTYTIISF